jgi:hypothetical protein
MQIYNYYFDNQYFNILIYNYAFNTKGEYLHE